MGVRRMTFESLRNDIFRLYGQQAYQSALDLLENQHFPNKAHHIYFWQACFHNLLNQPQAALDTLEKALALGHWYGESRLRYDPDLASLQGVPAFEKLVEVCKARQAEAQAKSVPGRLVIEPDENTPKPYPVLFVLHGSNGNAADHIHYWQPAAQQGWLVAALESSYVGGMDTYDWKDEDQTARDLHFHINELSQEYALDRQQVVIGGFSRGGQMAAKVVLNGAVEARGIIGGGAAISGDWSPVIDSTHTHEVRAYFIIGDQDVRFYQPTLVLAEGLQSRQIACQMKIYPGMGHVYPPDFESVLGDALGFVAA